MERKHRKKLIIVSLVLLGALCFGAGTLWGRYVQQQETEKVMAEAARSQEEETISQKGNTELLNLNTADYNELVSLPCIGDATARKILEFREEYGGFNELEDLVVLDLLTEQQLEKIAGKVTVFFP